MKQAQSDRLRSLYVDSPTWAPPIKVDDFLVAIGKTKTNSVYHVADVKSKPREGRLVRYYVKVYKSDLISCLKRDADQLLVPIKWRARAKKRNKNHEA